MWPDSRALLASHPGNASTRWARTLVCKWLRSVGFETLDCVVASRSPLNHGPDDLDRQNGLRFGSDPDSSPDAGLLDEHPVRPGLRHRDYSTGLFDEERVVVFDDLPAPERQHQGQGFVGNAQTWDLGIYTLGSLDHPACFDVVFRAMPGTHETPVFVDAAIGEVGEEVATPSRHGEQLTVGVADGIATGSSHGSGSQLGRRSDFYIFGHKLDLDARAYMSGACLPPVWWGITGSDGDPRRPKGVGAGQR